jgi:hypothetical protein
MQLLIPALRQGRQRQSQMTDNTLETVLRRDRHHCRTGMELCALARQRHGRHGHDRVPHDAGRDRNHAAGQRAMASDRVRVCVPDVGGDDGRNDGALGSAHDPHVRPRVGRQWKAQGKPFAATGWFAAGYLLAWSGFSLAATFLQWVIDRTALLDSRMAIASNLLGAIVLIAAGVYQWTPLKDVCLAQCQSPLLFLMRHGGFQNHLRGCLLLGLRHGGYCVGLLPGFDGAFVRRRGHERALDCAFGTACPFGETYAGRTMDRACCRHCMCGRGRLAAGVLGAVMSNLRLPDGLSVRAWLDLPSEDVGQLRHS